MTSYEIHRHNKAVIVRLQKKVLLDSVLLSSRAKRIVDDLKLTTLHDLICLDLEELRFIPELKSIAGKGTLIELEQIKREFDYCKP
jgi:hypothetical protein